MSEKIKLPKKEDLRKILTTKIYGEWKGGTCHDYVASWNLYCSLFDYIMDQAGREFTESELEFFCVMAVGQAVQQHPSLIHPFLYGIMSQILGEVVSDEKIARKLRRKFLKAGGLS
jgi:hypothetical protein